MYHWSGRVPRAGSSRRDGASTGACLLRYQVELDTVVCTTAVTVASNNGQTMSITIVITIAADALF